MAIRFSLFYAAHFLQLGVVLPFWPLVLTACGLTATELGLVMALTAAARIVVGPVVGYVSDRYQLGPRFLFAVGVGAAAGLSLFSVARGFAPVLALAVLVTPLYPAILPLVDAQALRTADQGRGDYGRIRLWGSAAFVVANLGGGALIAALGQGAILGVVVGLTLVGALAALVLPARLEGGEAVRPDLRLALSLLAQPRFFAVVLIAGGIQASHAVLYSFGTLAWRAQGLGESVIGSLWAVGVIAEIALLSQGRVLLQRAGAERLLLIGGVAGVLRWSLMALAPPLPVLFLLQLLHALTFAATFLGALHLVQRAVAPALAATGQAIYASIAGGIIFSAVTAGAGLLYARYDVGAYFAPALLAGMCAAGVPFFLRRQGAGPASGPTVIPTMPPAGDA